MRKELAIKTDAGDFVVRELTIGHLKRLQKIAPEAGLLKKVAANDPEAIKEVFESAITWLVYETGAVSFPKNANFDDLTISQVEEILQAIWELNRLNRVMQLAQLATTFTSWLANKKTV